MAQLFETVCMSLVFNKSHSLAMHYCRLVWDVRSLSKSIYKKKATTQEHFCSCVVAILFAPFGEAYLKT